MSTQSKTPLMQPCTRCGCMSGVVAYPVVCKQCRRKENGEIRRKLATGKCRHCHAHDPVLKGLCETCLDDDYLVQKYAPGMLFLDPAPPILEGNEVVCIAYGRCDGRVKVSAQEKAWLIGMRMPWAICDKCRALAARHKGKEVE